ncbi:hypothetical protein WDZ92_51625, partial [Nostoc sp. NIES-2111]
MQSVGFTSAANQSAITVPSELVKATSNSFLIEDLKQFEKYENLVKTESQLTGYIEKLKLSKNAIKDWADHYNIDLDVTNTTGRYGNTECVTMAALDDCPVIRNDVLRNLLIKGIKTGGIDAAPVGTNILQPIDDMYDISIDEQEKTVSLASRYNRITFNVSSIPSKYYESYIIFLATLTKGNKRNLIYYCN